LPLPRGAGFSTSGQILFVRRLSTQFANRTFDNPTQLEGAAGYIVAQFAAAGFRAESQRLEARGRSYRNLVVKLGPDTGDIVVIGAHYDALMVSLECIGYFSDTAQSQSHPVRLLNAIYPTTGNFIALVGHYEDGDVARRVKAAMKSATDLPVHSINAPGFVVGVDFSDHLNYWHEGFVGMMVTDTAFYRNKAYHTPQDTADRLDYLRMAKVVDAVKAVVLDQAGPATRTAP
jgi:hypothetical protein